MEMMEKWEFGYGIRTHIVRSEEAILVGPAWGVWKDVERGSGST